MREGCVSCRQHIIEEKIALFRITNGNVVDQDLPNLVYRLEGVRYRETATQVFHIAEEVTKKEYGGIIQHD